MEPGARLISVAVVLFGIIVYSLIPAPKNAAKREKPDWVKACKGRMMEKHGLVGYLYRVKRFVQDIGNSVVKAVGSVLGYELKIVFGCPASDKVMGTMSKLFDEIGFEKLETMVSKSLKKPAKGIHESDGTVS